MRMKLGQCQPKNGSMRLPDADPVLCDGGVTGRAGDVEGALHEIDWQRVGDIAFVPLEHQRKRSDVPALCGERFLKVFEALTVGEFAVRRRVCNKNNAVGTVKDHMTCSAEECLSWNTEGVYTQLMGPEAAEVGRKVVEE